MPEYRYILETCNEKIAFDNSKRRSVEACPFCGKGNKDGKFVPYIGFKDRGHCFSCGEHSTMGNHTCPGCGAEKAFNRYVDVQVNEQYLDDSVGKCLYCDYHYSPKQYFEKNGNIVDAPKTTQYTNLEPAKLPLVKPKPEPMPVSFIPVEVFKSSLKSHETNCFVRFLISLFGIEITSLLISRYFIATSKHWSGANVFWQIDISGKVRTGKIMLYDPLNGKRIKEPMSRVDWVHSVMKYPDYNLKQCFFGEHLLNDKTKPVALVESEKTAIIASVYLPQFTWLATGGKDGLNAEKCKVLAGRKVSLFPDISKHEINKHTTFELWSRKATELSNLARFNVSGMLESKATEDERLQGLDLADYLVRFDYNLFIHTQSQKVPVIESVQPVLLPPVQINSQDQPVIQSVKVVNLWDIQSLRDFFSKTEVPNGIMLNACTKIVDPVLFIKSTIEIIEANNGKETFFPYYQRLDNLRTLLSSPGHLILN